MADYIFIVDRGNATLNSAIAKEEIENKAIKETKAYKNNKLIYLNAQTWYVSGSGMQSINEMTAEITRAFD